MLCEDSKQYGKYVAQVKLISCVLNVTCFFPLLTDEHFRKFV